MHFDKQGSGPPVVLVHGLGAYLFSWRDTVAALSPRHTTYAVDLLGFGKSPPPTHFTIEAQADEVAALIAKERLTNPVIIGHSMGGGVCLDLASRVGAPSLSKMILIAPLTAPPSPTAGSIGDFAAVMQASNPAQALAEKLLKRAYAPTSTVTPAQIAGYARGISSEDQILAFYKYTKTVANVSFPATALSRINTETLIIWGKQDRVLPYDERADKLKQAIPGATLKPIENCGHIPHEEKPAETNKLITDFLSK